MIRLSTKGMGPPPAPVVELPDKPPLDSPPDPRSEGWYSGDLSWKLRPHGQTQVYQWIRKWQEEHLNDPGPLLINCHRRFGKTFVAYLLATEYSCRHPKSRTRIYSPSKEQGVDIADDVWPDVVDDRPNDMVWSVADGDVRVFNPRWAKKDGTPLDLKKDFSLIVYHGTEIKVGNRARGTGANLIILDEAQEMTQLERVMKRVIAWQTMKKKNRLIVILFTPPHRQHPLNETYIPQAIADGRYFEMPLSKDEDFSPNEISMVEKAAGSRHSISFKIEAECQWQLRDDQSSLVFPEWGSYAMLCHAEKRKNDYIWTNEYVLPDWYFPIVSMDWSSRHYTSALWSYWDFEEEVWIIRRELWKAGGSNTPEMLKLIREMTKDIFPNPKHAPTHFMDMTSASQEDDVRRVYRFSFTSADKTDRDVAISAMNSMIARGQLRVHASCTALLRQLDYGSFMDGASKKYASDWRVNPDNLMGDLDALDALRYGWKSLRRYQKQRPSPPEGAYIGHVFYPDLDEDELSELRLIREEELVF